jgi:Xaa-Pro aminopeptidase
MKIQFKRISITVLCVLCSLLSLQLLAFESGQNPEKRSTSHYPTILPEEKQEEIINDWLKIRLDTVLPEVMRREKIDMWIVICREYNEDPVFLTLMPARTYAARRTTILVFFDRGKNGLERLIVRPRVWGKVYKAAWTRGQTDQWQCLADIVKKRNPKRIGINESDTFAFGDGLTASLKTKLLKTLGKNFAPRLCSAENVAVGWLEKRTPRELKVYPNIVSIAHAIIAEAFSNQVIIPGITTTEDVQWWMLKKIKQLGLKPWFHPWVDLQRLEKGKPNESRSGIIQPGDLLHCDLGITYLRLNTDTQEHAYVLKKDESDVPEGLKKALQLGNRLQDIFTAEFKEGITGNQLLEVALSKSRKQGIKGQIYTHPLGYHGHGAGPIVGLWDNQGSIPGRGDYLLYYDTCYAIELNARVPIPEWNNQIVRIALEQDAVFTSTGVHYLDGRQTTFHIIK